MLWKRIQLVRTIRIMENGLLGVRYEKTGHDQGPFSSQFRHDPPEMDGPCSSPRSIRKRVKALKAGAKSKIITTKYFFTARQSVGWEYEDGGSN